MKLRAPLAAILVVALPFAAVGAIGAGCAQSGALQAGPSTSTTGATTGTQTSSSSATATTSQGSSSSASAAAVPSPIGPSLLAQTALCQAGQVGPAPLRRISRVEYDAMVHDLLNDTTQPATQFVSESPLNNGVNFNANTYTTVTSTLIPQQYLDAAETLAETAVATTPTNNLQNLLNGAPGGVCGQQTDACAQAFIDSFANRAFRGQYDTTESAALFQIYSATKAQFDFPTGIQAVITAVLTSPRFLFVFEFGAPSGTGATEPLAPYEMAARLALFLWRSVPDATLLQAAANNQLATAAQVQAQAQRMLKLPGAQVALDDFAEQWMELESTDAVTKDTQFGGWNATLADELKQETLHTYANEVVTENAGAGATLTELLTSPQSYIGTDVAKFYGVSGGDDSYATKTNVNPAGSTIRAGVLTNAAVLATQSHTSLPSPVLRGKLVREQVLCDPVPPPPAGGVNGMPIPPPPASVPAGETLRQVDETTHLNVNAVCTSCHTFMDPIGFGFGHFDATGAYQATDSNGLDAGPYPPIDATGTVTPMGANDVALTFNGAVDLATQLSTQPRVAQCFALQEFRYALSRIESTSDACSLQQAYQSFSSNALNLQSLIIAIVGSDSFRLRNVETAGSDCK